MTLDLEPIRARLAAATPGPWFRRQIGTLAPEVASHHTTTWYGSPCTEAVVTHGFHNDNDLDLDLIANAPSDLAALLAEVERLRESVQRVRELAETWRARGEHQMAYAETVPEDVRESLLDAGANWIDMARHTLRALDGAE